MTVTPSTLTPQQLKRPTRYGYRRTTVTNWGELIPGDNVVITGPGPNECYRGIIDAVLEDGSVVWLILAEAGGRRMFLTSDGHQILVDPNRHQLLTQSA